MKIYEKKKLGTWYLFGTRVLITSSMNKISVTVSWNDLPSGTLEVKFNYNVTKQVLHICSIPYIIVKADFIVFCFGDFGLMRSSCDQIE